MEGISIVSMPRPAKILWLGLKNETEYFSAPVHTAGEGSPNPSVAEIVLTTPLVII